ncbi:MAG: alpha-amylase [Treponema sp.]|nr:alpha-amylase [Treponema sp.]
MHISYNEFHISKKVRDLCSFEEGLFASSGNVVFANMRNVRSFQVLFNNYIDTVTGDENKRVSAGQLNAMGLIDEILHYVCMLYRRNKVPTFMHDLMAALEKQYTAKEIDALLLDFLQEFPPVEVYKEKCTAREYLSRTAIDIGTGEERSNREQTLEELVLLHLANENAAFKPFLLLFGDTELAKNKLYGKTWTSIKKFAKAQPTFGPFDHDLINLLKEPQAFAPDSLKGQLEYIQKYWAEFLGEWLKRILAGMDTISEEEKAAWHGFGGGDLPDMSAYTFENLMNEYERYSPDSDWMPKVILIAKTVLVWLDQLTKQYGYPITRLDQIPDPELDKLRDEGFTGLWLIGLWERSKASRRIKQICGNPEAAASAYSLYDYNIAQNIGGWDALANLRTRLWQRGIRLASDMVPNHTGMDGDWVINRPDLFIQRRDCPFPHYTFNGENLSQDGRVSLFLEDHYYTKNDCSVVFKRVDNQTGDTRYIYHGNDGTGLPWNDTAQIDFLNPEAREAVMQEILHVAHNFPIIRFDAAMVLAKKSIRRLWYPESGHGGDIATRSETGLSTQQFNDAIPNEFWREVVDRVARECPDTLLLAEAFWMMEGYFVRTLGMHRVYNSAFMNMLKKEENQKYRETVKNTITFDPQVLKRYVNFMNNPDEETAIAQFGDGDKYFGVCTLMITMPGLPMFGHGQIEGFTEKYGMEYTRAYKDEQPNQYLVDRHWREIFPLMKKRYLFSGVENFLFYDLWQDGVVNENVFAYSNGCGNERTFVVYNNKYDRAYGWIKQSDPYAVKTGNGDETKLISRSISEGLNLNGEDDKFCIFRENRSNLWYIRKSKEICEKGLFVMLNGFEYQVYMDIHQVTDEADGRYRILCEHLNGSGCEDIETAWQEIIYKELYESMKAYIGKILPCVVQNFKSVDKTFASAEKEIKKFNEECSKILKTKATVQEFTKSVTSRLKLLSKIQKEKAPKKPADLQKALLKCSTRNAFAKLMMNENSSLKNMLIFWALTGLYSETSLPKDTNFARIYSQSAKEYELEISRYELTKLFILSSVSDLKKLKTKAPLEIASLLVKSRYSSMLCGVNAFDNILWFNKEMSDESLNTIFLLAGLISTEKAFESVSQLYKKLCSAKLKAAYKCALFLKPFEPAKSKKKTVTSKKTPVKKTVKKDMKETPVKKTSKKTVKN